ncbi:helix-turn-helix domain-containing protein [Aquibacillus kalidii]|uniref:helix-turn-helix domain-containing protein n=1 Tax=Aquibacillus kalidii TaxID=2762597 RepID=UPI001647B25A|nr:helix-turn-helix domain-containing protein [Aquibacillus kalidii]
MLNIRELQNEVSFNSIKSMDTNINNFFKHHKFDLNESTYKVLRDLQQHSVKFIGVSFSKYATIAQRLSISPRTVIRAINSLVDYGIIKKIKTRKNTGKQGSNIFVIQQWQSESHSECHSDNEVIEPTESRSQRTKFSSETEYKQSINISKQSNNVKPDSTLNRDNLSLLDSSFIPTNVNKSFIDIAKSFFNPSQVYGLWKRVLIAYNKARLSMPINHYVDQVIKVFKTTVFAYKNGYIRTTFNQYFYGGLINVFHQIKRSEVHNSSNTLYYDWLNEG